MSIPEALGIPEWEFRVVVGRTRIDYDLEKEAANRAKHGYSLESAVQILERIILPLGGPRVISSSGFLERGEVRHMHMSLDDSHNVVVVVTTMRPDETVRVISYRRASSAECETYWEEIARAEG